MLTYRKSKNNKCKAIQPMSNDMPYSNFAQCYLTYPFMQRDEESAFDAKEYCLQIAISAVPVQRKKPSKEGARLRTWWYQRLLKAYSNAST